MASNSASLDLMKEVEKLRKQYGIAAKSPADLVLQRISRGRDMENTSLREIKETNPTWDKFWEN